MEILAFGLLLVPFLIIFVHYRIYAKKRKELFEKIRKRNPYGY